MNRELRTGRPTGQAKTWVVTVIVLSLAPVNESLVSKNKTRKTKKASA